MKSILMFAVVIAASFNLSGQNDLHHEIAIDAAPLIRSSAGYTLMYRYNRPTVGIRLQANAYYESTSANSTQDATTPVGANSSSYTMSDLNILNMEYRAGIQRNWAYESWAIYLGIDFLYNTTSNEVKTDVKSPQSYGTTRNTSQTTVTGTGYGAAPLLGIKYDVSKRFFVSLENSFAYTTSQIDVTRTDAYYFTPVKGTEALNNMNTGNSSASSDKFDFTPSRYLRLYVGCRF